MRVEVGSDSSSRRMIMLRKTAIALLAVASVGLAAPTMALARGGGDGGFRGGGRRFGEFRGRGFHDRDFGRRRFGFGDYYDDYADYNPYGYGYGYYPYRYGYGYPYASSYGYY